MENNRGMNATREIGIKWEHPLDGWVKLNTNGASKGNPGQAGVGGIVRGRGGRPLSMFAANCGVASCTKAEFLAVLKGLALVWNLGNRRIVLEVDSLVVARALLGEDIPSSTYYHGIRRCKEMVNKQDWEVVVSHCYREANRAADWLANYGVGLIPKLVIMEAAPVSLRTVLLEDVSGVVLLRRVPAVVA